METKLIEQYKTKRLELEQAEDEMNDHFERIVDSMLKTSKAESDFIEIKERLRVMPESASKVLLFRKIILTERDA